MHQEAILVHFFIPTRKIRITKQYKIYKNNTIQKESNQKNFNYESKVKKIHFQLKFTLKKFAPLKKRE